MDFGLQGRLPRPHLLQQTKGLNEADNDTRAASQRCYLAAHNGCNCQPTVKREEKRHMNMAWSLTKRDESLNETEFAVRRTP